VEIVEVYALPRDVLEAPAVKDAIKATVRAMLKANPEMKIKGIAISTEDKVVVR
jgi:hypothetical protein